jgi:hypothetical protein
MKKLPLIISFICILAFIVCSEAPINYPEPTNRIVLGEFFTSDM